MVGVEIDALHSNIVKKHTKAVIAHLIQFAQLNFFQYALIATIELTLCKLHKVCAK